MRNGEVSFWWRESDTGRPGVTCESLDGDFDADIAIVGGGLTGLWSAYYLRRARPDARIVVLESRFCGFGASGRNGGWLSAEVPGNRDRYGRIAEQRGLDGVAANRRMTAVLEAAVDEVLDRLCEEKIDADAVKSGIITVARCAAQQVRLREELQAHHDLGGTGSYLLSRSELGDRLQVADAVAGSFTPHCARVQPAKLSAGVAAAVQRLGVRIAEGTTVRTIEPGRVSTDRGVVRAEKVLICAEGFTAALPGRARDLLPMNSSMVVTEPLDAALWDEIGWRGAELLGETAHAYTYSQRTADGRIALGGRGVPYRFGSRIDSDGRTQERTATAIATALRTLFPAAAQVPIAHAWCGVLGVNRDWSTSIGFDPASGIGGARGYVGSGLTMTNVAARTLRDLVLGESTELTELPWVNHHPRRWEFEPLRYLGVSSMYACYRFADRWEMARGSTSTALVARVADRISGRH